MWNKCSINRHSGFYWAIWQKSFLDNKKTKTLKYTFIYYSEFFFLMFCGFWLHRLISYCPRRWKSTLTQRDLIKTVLVPPRHIVWRFILNTLCQVPAIAAHSLLSPSAYSHACTASMKRDVFLIASRSLNASIFITLWYFRGKLHGHGFRKTLLCKWTLMWHFT